MVISMSMTEKLSSNIPNLNLDKWGGCCGVDVYNQELTGNIVCSLTAACGGTNTSGGKVIVEVKNERSIGLERSGR